MEVLVAGDVSLFLHRLVLFDCRVDVVGCFVGSFEVFFFEEVFWYFECGVFDVVDCFCFVVDDDVVDGSVGVEHYAYFVDDIWVEVCLLGVSSYYLLKLPNWMV